MIFSSEISHAFFVLFFSKDAFERCAECVLLLESLKLVFLIFLPKPLRCVSNLDKFVKGDLAQKILGEKVLNLFKEEIRRHAIS